MASRLERLYATRRLTEGSAELEARALEVRETPEWRDGAAATDVDRTLIQLARLIELPPGAAVAVIGCGQRPSTLERLLALGYRAVGVEPVAGYVRAAGEHLGRPDAVLRGTAEAIPLPDGSQRVVLLENVLEHVDSVSRTLAEVFRVTAPGGIAYVRTNARRRVSLTGWTGEYRVRFFNWLPALLQECWVHHHLHLDSTLAHHSPRPAVHWFDFARLCRAGREAGFARFYGLPDVLRRGDPSIARSPLRRLLLGACQDHPLLRALALSQLGGYVFMFRRPDAD